MRPCFSTEERAHREAFLRMFYHPRHEFYMLVRQLEPGVRERLLIYYDTTADIPDIEEIIHSMFDAYGEDKPAGASVTINDVKARTREHVAARDRRPS
jgi:hypothetical protein